MIFIPISGIPSKCTLNLTIFSDWFFLLLLLFVFIYLFFLWTMELIKTYANTIISISLRMCVLPAYNKLRTNTVFHARQTSMTISLQNMYLRIPAATRGVSSSWTNGGVTYQATISQSSFVNGALSKEIENRSKMS